MAISGSPKIVSHPGQKSLKTTMTLKVSLLFVVAVAVVSFCALAYLEQGIRRSIDNEHYALAKDIVFQTRMYLSLGILAATSVVLVLVWQLMKCLTTPLLSLTRQVESMEGARELTPLDAAGSSREIGTLVDAFNRMVGTVRRQQLDLEENEEHFRILVESSPDAILLHRDGVFLYANSAALRLFGAERAEQLVGRPVDLTVHPDYKSLVRERIQQAQSVVGHANPRHEEKVLRLDGSAIDVEAVGTHLVYQGEPAVQVVLRDITDRKAAERALRESEETLRNLMAVMPVGVALIEQDGTFAYLNHRFEEHFGYNLADVPSLDAWYARAYPDPDYRAELVASINANLEAQENGAPVAPTEVNITCKDGSVRHMIINRQRAGNRRLVIFTDITERESIQNELLKAQKLESLGVLAGGIAHDFNNILTGILGNITLAQMLLDPTHPSCQPLTYAERAAARAGDLATQLLTFAKGGTPVKKEVTVSALVEEAVSLALRGANVIGKVRIPSGLHAIEADEGQMSQVFHNVVFNAVQAMPGGGTLIVNAANVTLDSGNKPALPPGDYVQITFADQGHGMTDEILNKIFDPYFTTKPGGTGLGLASVHSIVKKHGGHVEVRSLVGRGTDFTFYLPSLGTVGAGPEAAGDAVERGRHAGGAVLVMDDDELIQTLAGQILELLGYQVTICANGEEAVALYEKAAEAGTPFHAAIMDLTIPGGMGGKEAAQRMLAFDPAARLIVSSGYFQRSGHGGFPVLRFLRRHCQAVPGSGTGCCAGSPGGGAPGVIRCGRLQSKTEGPSGKTLV